MKVNFQEIIKGIIQRKELRGNFDINMANKIRQKKDISIKEKIALGKMFQPFIVEQMKNKELFKKLILVSFYSFFYFFQNSTFWTPYLFFGH